MKDLAQHIENKNLLYIHGLNSSANSTTARLIKQYLGDKFNIHTHTWNLTQPGTEKDINKFVADNNISVVIASSLGAFYALTITDSVAKILINPCMHPSVEVPKLTEISDSQIEHFRKLEERTYTHIDAEMRMCTFAGFGDKDELFNYQAEFKKKYGSQMVAVSGGHRLQSKSLYKVIESGLSYFESIQSHLNEGMVCEKYTNLFRDDPKANFDKWKDQAYDLLQKSYAPIGGLLGVPDADALVNDSDMWKIVNHGNRILAIVIYTFKRTGRKLTACGCLQGPDGKADPGAKAWLYDILSADMKIRNGWAEVDDKMEHIMQKSGGVPVPVDVAELLMKGKRFTYKDPDGYHYRRIIGGEEHTKILYANPNGEQIKNNTVDK